MRNLNISNNEYLKMYHAYTDLMRIICGSDGVFYTCKEFLENRPMCVINMTKRMRGVDNEKTSIKRVLDFEKDVPAKTVCYIIMLGPKSFDYDIKNQRITESI
jgi:hypothetical protein